MTKRADGALEQDVLRVLWLAERPLLPAEVRDQVTGDLAYTSIATVLGRLHVKGLVSRAAAGRAYAYAAVVDESKLTVRRLEDVLAKSTDRQAALAGLVSHLSRKERNALRALLDSRSS